MNMNESFATDMNDSQRRLLEEILLSTEKIPDAPVKDMVIGNHLITVTSANTGLCTKMMSPGLEVRDKLPCFSGSAKELASLLVNPLPESPDTISFAMAAINSLLPVPEVAFPLKAQDFMVKNGKGKNAAVIGHFPFVDEVGPAFRNLWVLEIHPRPGDLPAETAKRLIPQADIIALTATTLLNGTCTDILSLIRKDAFIIMLGPSTPFAPCLFDWGIDALAGSFVKNTPLVNSHIREGLPYRKLKGIDKLIWVVEKGS
jgi:uncharacterized protein (DUF4213/DUF364 family)